MMLSKKALLSLTRGHSRVNLLPGIDVALRSFSLGGPRYGTEKYRIVVVGGGSAGSAISAMMASNPLKKDVAVVEPSQVHYYQPLWTLVGGGLKTFEQSARPMKDVLSNMCTWFQQKAVEFNPDRNSIKLGDGTELEYECLVVAMGLQLNYDGIKGLPQAFETDDMLVSNYSPKYVTRTKAALDRFKGGNAIFTLPNTPIKCPGAPQKIMYLAEEIFRKNQVRDKANIYYTTAMGVMLGAPKYAKLLKEIALGKGCELKFLTNLIEVKPETKEAVFQKLGTDPVETFTMKYDFMHITPPMSTPNELKNSALVDATGFLPVNKETLQHNQFKNVFGIGDCTNVPTPKTAAAVASQLGTLETNLKAFFAHKDMKATYDGYTSCPVVTSSKECMMAEFVWQGEPKETFPFDQGKPTKSMYLIKSAGLPALYWMLHVKGKWTGPAGLRKLLNPRGK